MELPEGSPVLIGQLPLVEMDLVPSPEQGTIIPNPAHGDEWTLDLYCALFGPAQSINCE
jgi:hypothetical protein